MKHPVKKYVVVPGYIRSKNDGDEHFISSFRLCELYGVDPEECYLHSHPIEPHLNERMHGLPILRPRYDGNYSLESLS